MPLFKTKTNTDGGQSYEVICPRCKTPLQGDSVHTSGEGVNVRIIEGDYRCECSYSVKVTERIPLIQGEML